MTALEKPRAAISRLEAPVVRWCARLERRPAIRLAMLAATRAGDGWALFLLVPMAAWMGGARGLAAVACGAAASVVVAAVVHAIKALVRRRRPEAIDLLRPVTAPDLHAFPSGHTAHAFCLMVVAWWIAPWFGAAFVPFAVLVALSRIVFGLHYPSDVLVGAVLGSGLSALTLGSATAVGLVDWLVRISPIG
jgi:undecaprenyl-diphosphatase